MGNRATCPVCNSYGSNVFYDIENEKNCRSCGCLHKFLEEYQCIIEIRENYKKNKIEEEILKENEKLYKENCELKTKIDKLTCILGYEFDSPIVNMITNVLKILHGTDK